MRILSITARLPFSKADHAGGILIYNRLTALARNHELYLISFVYPGEEDGISDVGRYCRKVWTVPITADSTTQLRRLPLYLLHSPSIVRHWNPRMAQIISQVASDYDLDLVQIDYTEMAQYVKIVSDRYPVVLLEIDVSMSVLKQQFDIETHWWRKIRSLWWWWSTRCFETSVLGSFHKILTFSEKDRRYLLKTDSHLDVSTVPPLLDLSFSSCVEKPPHNKDLLFCGNMVRRPNIEAVNYLCEEIFPLVKRAVPESRLFIVGAGPTEQIKALSDDESIIVTGYVRDILEFYKKCRVFIAPLLVSGGIIKKILDALAVGRPVVTTSLGNEGIAAKPGCGLLIADDPQMFAEHVIQLLTDDLLWMTITQNGWHFVRTKYDSSAILNQLEEIYASLLERKPPSK